MAYKSRCHSHIDCGDHIAAHFDNGVVVRIPKARPPAIGQVHDLEEFGFTNPNTPKSEPVPAADLTVPGDPPSV